MISRCSDYRLIKKIVPWNPVISSKIIYLTEDNIGLWTFHKHIDGVKIHADMGIKCRGRKAVQSAKSAFKWIFENTSFKKIYAEIPKENKPACRIAAWSGMDFTGVNNNRRCYEVVS